MEQKVIEGTWEEVARRSQELAGHRVRVTVLDDSTLPKATNGNHADEVAFPPVKDPILGMFSEDAQLLDEVVEEAMKIREERLPGPFLEDEMTGAPVDLPRPGPSVPRSCVWDAVRHPDLAYGE